MATSTIQGDVAVAGNLSCQGFSPPANSIYNAAVATGGSGANIGASKLQQQHQKTAQHCNHATSAAADRRQIHQVVGATGTITSFGVTASVAAGAASTITVDLKKNGVSILSATITLDNTTAAYVQKQAGGFTSNAVVAGDLLEADITAVSGANLPKGVSTHLNLREDPQ